MKTIYDESILAELHNIGFEISHYTDNYLHLTSVGYQRFSYKVEDLEKIEVLLGAQLIQVFLRSMLWRKI